MANHRQQTRVNYGFDGSPFSVLFVFCMGIICLKAGGTLTSFHIILLTISGVFLFTLGSFIIFICGSYFYYVTIGKRQRMAAMLSLVAWNGTETVLDVGTGRGLLMIGAAKKLTIGKSIGIDIWNSSDMHGNTPQNTMRNAELEGVLEKVEVRDDDVRSLSFANASFDVVLSNLCLHNIPTEAERTAACKEIARVLKPHGVAIIADKSHTKQYGEIFAAEGLSVESFRPCFDGSLRAMVKAVKK